MSMRERLRSTEARLFLFAVALELLVSAVLLAEGRYPPAHDGFLHLVLQWFHLDGAATTGELPRWMPYVTGGNVATWWWSVQASEVTNALSLLGTWLRAGDFLVLWHVGMLADELILLVGVWLLARRLVTSPYAIFLTTIAALGSTSWALQPFYSLRLVHALPLLLELGHRFLESGRWRHAALAGALLVVQSFGSPPYFFPVVTFTLFTWFAAHLAISPDARRRLRGIPLGAPALAAIASSLLLLGVAWVALHAGTDEVVQFSHRREGGGAVTLGWFLSYGGNGRMRKWLELFTRVTPALDYTVYASAFTLPFALIGVLCGTRRTNAHVLVALVVLLELSMAHPFSAVVYWVWPLMRYYRHLTLLGVLPKLFLCFLAGIGVDRLLGAAGEPGRARIGPITLRPVPFTVAGGLAAALLLGGAAWTWSLGSSPDAPGRMAAFVPTLAKFLPALDPATLPARLHLAAGISAVAGLTACAFAFPSLRRRTALAAIALATADLYAWKVEHLRLSTTPIGDARREILDFTPLPWIPARCRIAPCGARERRALLDLAAMPGGTKHYAVAQMVVFEDGLGTALRVDNWLAPYHAFLRAAEGAADPFDPALAPSGYVPSVRLQVPESPAIDAAAGIAPGKLQLHAHAYEAPERRIAAEISSPGWRGDVLFLAEGTPGALPLPDVVPVEGTRREGAPIEVLSFQSNALSVQADAGAEPAWLYVAETWHSGWRARVDGAPAPVARANLGWRAVALPPGRHLVELDFPLPSLAIPQAILGLAGAATLAWTAWLAWSIVAGRTANAIDSPASIPPET